MSIYDRLHVTALINAADSYTILGGSRIPAEVWSAMEEASRSFVRIEELHDRVGERLAELTRNEAAMVTSGAAAGVAIAVAACMTGTDAQHILKFPALDGLKKEVIAIRSHRNGFQMAISQTGAKLVEAGDSEATTPEQLREAITPDTACFIFFDMKPDEGRSVSLEEVIAIAKPLGIPVIVDAAAQLPPVDNLWNYTQKGADLVIFSGGKTLCGPQSSGLIVGRKALIEACRMNVGPRISIGRPMKVGKEEMVGLLAAVERYVALDQAQVKERFEAIVADIRREAESVGCATGRLYPGPTGQDYPRAAVRPARMSAEQLKEKLEQSKPSIIVTLTADKEQIVINPLHLSDSDVKVVIERLKAIAAR
ncbi:MAG: hypothetical protein K0Q59_3355 [Paenibacillus sp.]|jgi:L-seryl-tRNA(Ser) seleniumtransferase|nr:hypothetical protein [Paenibacillus sp.]